MNTNLRKLKIMLRFNITSAPKECVICGGRALERSIIHTEWYKRMWKCGRCAHIALYDKNNVSPQDHFFTVQERANEHLKITGTQFTSILDFGTPDGFFLTKVIAKEKYAYDLYPYKDLPEGVKEWHKEKIDFLYSSHSLEHMPDPKEFLKILPEKFFVEVPYYPDWFVECIGKGIKTTRWHYQLFNEKSFKEFFGNVKCTIELISKTVEKSYARGKQKGVLRAYNL